MLKRNFKGGILIYLILFLQHLALGSASRISAQRASSLSLRPRAGRIWDHQIRCIGSITTALSNGWKVTRDARGKESYTPVEFENPRALCAKPWYGGRGDANLGGYCGHVFGKRVLLFELSPLFEFTPRHTPTGTYVESLSYAGELKQWGYQFCQLRCRCVAQTHESIQSWPAPEILRAEPENPVYFDYNPTESIPLPQRQTGITVNVGFLAEDKLDVTTSLTQVMAYSPSSNWGRPGCLSLLPLLFPIPFKRSDYSHGQELCASIFHGGSPKGNVGLVCLKSDGKGGQSRRRLGMVPHLSQ